MIENSDISFAWSPMIAVMAILIAVATAILSFIACQRTNWRRSTVLLEGTRMLIVLLAVILLGGPEWIQQFRPNTKPVVAVLYDDSDSMTTQDVTATSGPSKTISRKQAIEALINEQTWDDLKERAEVIIEPFSGPQTVTDANDDQASAARNDTPQIRLASLLNTQAQPAAEADDDESDTAFGTNLSGPISQTIQQHENLLGVFVVSDGDWNVGGSPVNAAGKLRAAGVPIFALPVGSDTRLPDIELISFDVPTFAIASKKVRIPFTVESSLPRDHMANVVLETEDGQAIEKQVRVAAMGRTADFFEWTPDLLGDRSLKLTVDDHPSEIRQDNNTASAPISIREEKLKVLIVESFPRWEYRYLRNSLSRDPGVTVSCLLFHPGLEKRGGGNKDYISSFPATKEELAEYDVVFLGDVGLDDNQLTIEQCDLLHGLVQDQASGLVFLPGWEGRQFTLLETKLAELMPVNLDDTQLGGWGSRTAQHFELTEMGRRSLLTKLADTADENLAVWGNLPGFQWYAPVTSAKNGTETLAVHQEASNQYGRIPLLVTRTFGSGKVLFMGTDGAWRWRKGVEDKYHYRFWGQVVRWMAYRRNMAQGETMRMYYSPERPRVRQTVSFDANVMEISGEPLSKGTVVLRITSPSNRLETVRLQSSGGQWGAFSGRFTSKEPGQHKLQLFCKETGQTLDTSLFIQGESLEKIGQPARPEVLEELARMTQGSVISFNQLPEIIQQLNAMPDPPPTVRRVALWSHPITFAVLVGLLGLFWIARKGAGLI
ncbi:hypothetical protein SV7mr_23010 [Stieleria bergensis]|uniref:Glutamine amidotransferase domain-containing protein n=1 Tax=Stieleria bergensis TaxID=2528025 RepID=A0A517SUJ9_9BACT|nr:hypothetical protein SV7mr_23010 [Planctomycetes bacterium SV_7m_r]